MGRPLRASPFRDWISAAGACSADSFDRSRIQPAIVAAIASNLELADVAGDVRWLAHTMGLDRDSVVDAAGAGPFHKHGRRHLE
ncbi:MAG: hypothetical protein ABSH32_29695 [Bryobacteraceae bacterium]